VACHPQERGARGARLCRDCGTRLSLGYLDVGRIRTDENLKKAMAG